VLNIYGLLIRNSLLYLILVQSCGISLARAHVGTPVSPSDAENIIFDSSRPLVA
jgi:hypothetical protein